MTQQFGQYKIIRCIAKKSNKHVYLATKDNNQVIMHCFSIKKSEQIKQLMQEECNKLPLLTHPCILQIHNITWQDSKFFIVVELTRNISLKRLFKTQSFSLKLLLKIAQNICSSVLFLHENNITHGNINPSMFFMDANGETKMLCCGIEKYLSLKKEQKLHYENSKTFDLFCLRNVLYNLFSWSKINPSIQKKIIQFKPQGDELEKNTWKNLSQLITSINEKSNIVDVIKKLQFLEKNLQKNTTSFATTSGKNITSNKILLDDCSEKDATLVYATNQLAKNENNNTSPNLQSTTVRIKNTTNLDSLTNSSSTFLQKNAFFSHYRVISKLGEGGMGVVFKVEDTKLHREVALKLILPKEEISPLEIKRFLIEAKANAQLDHPNIVRLLEIGKQPQNYFTMEYIDGDTLKKIAQEKKLTYQKIVKILSQVADALKLAHSKNIIHRDIKPANILITTEGNAKLMDFGLAKLEGAHTQLSQSGEVMGTAAYMSPEQVNGEKIDHRSDIYSLGATFYELVTGRAVFEGILNVNILYQVVSADPILPRQLNPDIPIELEAICLKCLEKSPNKRYQLMGDLLLDLENYLCGKTISAKAPNIITHIQKTLLRHKILTISTCIILLTIISGALFSYQQWQATEKAVVDAIEQKKIAQKERKEKTSEARASNVILSNIALTRAIDAYKNKQWRGCGILAGASLEFIKNFKGKKIRRIRKQARFWVRQAIFQQRLLWVNRIHTEAIIAVAISKTNYIATASLDQTIKIWNSDTGSLFFHFNKSKHEPTSLCFNQKGNKLACAYKNDLVNVYDFDSKKITHRITNIKNPSSINFSKNGQNIIFITKKKIHVYNLKTKKTTLFKSDPGWIKFANFDYTDQKVFSLSSDGNLETWNINSKKRTTLKLVDKYPLEQISLGPENKKLATIYSTGLVKIWDIKDKNFIDVMIHRERITSIQLSSNMKMLAVASENNKIHLIDIEKKQVSHVYSGHTAKINKMQFTSDNQKLISVSDDKTIRCWLIHKPLFFKNPTQSELGMTAFSLNGKIIGSSSSEKKSLYLWDSHNGKLISTLKFDNEVSKWFFMKNNNILVLQKKHFEIINWKTKKKRIIAKRKTKIISTADYNAQKNILVFITTLTDIYIWNVAKNKKIKQFKTIGTQEVHISRDAKFLVYHDISKLFILNIKTKKFEIIQKEKPWIQGNSISQNNQMIATSFLNGEIQIWNAKNLKLRNVLQGHSGLITSTQFSKDSKKLISSDTKGKSILWNIEAGIPIKIFNARYCAFDQNRRLAFTNNNVEVKKIFHRRKINYKKVPKWVKIFISNRKYKRKNQISNFDFRKDLIGQIIKQALNKAPLETCRYLFELKTTENLSWEIDDDIFRK